MTLEEVAKNSVPLQNFLETPEQRRAYYVTANQEEDDETNQLTPDFFLHGFPGAKDNEERFSQLKEAVAGEAPL